MSLVTYNKNYEKSKSNCNSFLVIPNEVRNLQAWTYGGSFRYFASLRMTGKKVLLYVTGAASSFAQLSYLSGLDFGLGHGVGVGRG